MAKTGNRDESIRAVEMIAPTAKIYHSVRGSKIEIAPSTRIMDYVVIQAVGGAGDVVIGERCYINPHCVLYSGNGIHIGNDVLIGPGTCIVPTNHAFGRLDAAIAKQGFMPSKGGIVIESNVWIGANCTILDGAWIESGCVIAAGTTIRGRHERGVWANGATLVKLA